MIEDDIIDVFVPGQDLSQFSESSLANLNSAGEKCEYLILNIAIIINTFA